MRIVAEADDAVHLLLLGQMHQLLLQRGIVVRGVEEHAVLAGRKLPVDAVDKLREEGTDQIRHHDGDGIGPVAAQPAGIAADPVVELFDGGLHAQAVFLADGDAVDDLGDGAQRDARLAGYVLHRRDGFVFRHHRSLNFMKSGETTL